jgi:hypothetical protein
MKKLIGVMLFVIFSGVNVFAQAAPFQDTLLEKMTGKWVMAGTIDNKPTTHDISVEWVLDHLYLQIKEVSREKKADGSAEYQAIVYIGWDSKLNKYSCLWLDNTGGSGLNPGAYGYAERLDDKIPFLFKIAGTNFHTTFMYDKSSDTWQWLMDGEVNGKLEPFARVTLTKQK